MGAREWSAPLREAQHVELVADRDAWMARATALDTALDVQRHANAALREDRPKAEQSHSDRARAFFSAWGLIAHGSRNDGVPIQHEAMAALAQAFADERRLSRDVPGIGPICRKCGTDDLRGGPDERSPGVMVPSSNAGEPTQLDSDRARVVMLAAQQARVPVDAIARLLLAWRVETPPLFAPGWIRKGEIDVCARCDRAREGTAAFAILHERECLKPWRDGRASGEALICSVHPRLALPRPGRGDAPNERRERILLRAARAVFYSNRISPDRIEALRLAVNLYAVPHGKANTPDEVEVLHNPSHLGEDPPIAGADDYRWAVLARRACGIVSDLQRMDREVGEVLNEYAGLGRELATTTAKRLADLEEKAGRR